VRRAGKELVEEAADARRTEADEDAALVAVDDVDVAGLA